MNCYIQSILKEEFSTNIFSDNYYKILMKIRILFFWKIIYNINCLIKQQKRMNKLKIVCIGDSLTYGYRVRRSKTWINLSEKELKINIENKGISGDTTGGMLARFREDVISKKPKIVFIMGGSNDIITGADLGVPQSNIMAMVHQARGNMITPILGLPTKIDVDEVIEEWSSFADYKKISEQIDKYNNWLKRFSKAFEIDYIDFNSFIKGLSEKEIHSIYLDGLHFNDKGHELMEKIFIEKIKTYL